MTILHIDSSILGANSVSRDLTAAIVAELTAQGDAQVLRRDLADPKSEAAFDGDPVDQLMSADTLVIGAPMYNFAIPHQLKAWIDSIAVAGKTFHYTAEGPKGLAGGRRAIVVYASGGVHDGTTDFVEPYLRQVLGFIGITDVTVLRVEGVALSPEARAKAIEEARAKVPSLVAKAA
ncbi:FMN-dependent NADH-azoreductase [Limimaricola hongkongensis]|uniref:FMN dependent NADH:quinone oxidoreductase n=1 Tax=Limimaricola hongkongensis DSM 17492 TaxID=1122180 RepID=A0A017HC93_9RHOB|nr:NAD(P)H-dependent oxidoreductase [Limimaricola hongkongensis]EYD71991.1 FMN-dependent NADH-azoreductase [Limimaricola hongkongensis DSM 17492]